MHLQPEASSIAVADQPLWAPGAPDMIAEFIRAQPSKARVLEFGSGGATKFLLNLGAKVVAVEHHKGWADAVMVAAQQKGLSDQLTLLLREQPYSGVVAEFENDMMFDILLVDGRDRMDCLRGALPFVRPGGLVLVDDSQRMRYWPAFQILAAQECTTFLGKARNTTIWKMEAAPAVGEFVRKSFITSGKTKTVTPFVQLLPHADISQRLQPDYQTQRPIKVNGPLETELQKLGLIGRRASFVPPKGYRLKGTSLRLENGRKYLSQKEQVLNVGGTGLAPVEGQNPFEGQVSLSGHTLDLTASGAGRYSFFLLDSLPKLKLAEAAGFLMSDFDTILVNSNAKWARDILKTVIGADCPQIKAFSASAPSFRLERSVHFAPVRAGRFTPAWVHKFLDEVFAFQVSESGEGGKTASFGPRVYISRERATGRRIVNHPAFLELLTAHGFREVFAEDYSPIDLVRALDKTLVVISPHGAGLANILFCQPAATVIELFSSHFTPQYLYLARDRGQTYIPMACKDDEGLNVFDRYTPATPDKAAFNRKDIVVDLEALDGLLRTLT